MKPPTKHSFKAAIVIVIAMVLGSVWIGLDAIFATVTVSTSDKAVEEFVPRGQKLAMLTFTLKSTGGTTSMGTINLTSNKIVRFGNGIDSVSLYKGSFTDADTPIKTVTFSRSSSTTVLTFTDNVPSDNVGTSYFLVASFAKDAPLTISSTSDTVNSANMIISSITDSDGNSVTPGSNSSKTISVSGYKRVIARVIAPDIVLSGQTGIPMLSIAVRPVGEAVSHASGLIEFKIQNQFANFSTTGSQTGISTVYLMNDPGSASDPKGKAWGGTITAEDYASIQDAISSGSKINGSLSFTSASEAVVTFNQDALNFPVNVTTNLILVYDIGTSFPITANTQVAALMSSLKGKGNLSNFPMQADGSALLLATPAKPAVGGLGYANMGKIITTGSYGSNTIIPILQMGLYAYQTTINVTQISIGNPQNNLLTTTPFTTSSEDVDGVTRVRLFQDNGNGTFDGISSDDTLIGSYTTGHSQNTGDRVDIPITLGSNSFSQIKKFDKDATGYPADNSKRIFVIYDIGKLSSSRSTVTSQLTEARAIAFVSTNTSRTPTRSTILSGTKPAIPTPPATVSLRTVDVGIISCTPITPTPAYVTQGRNRVPMLAMRLYANSVISSASITIRNANESFFADGRGANKIWIYKDNAPIGTLDANDVFLASNDKLITTQAASFSGVPFVSGDNYFLVLYDIGQNADIASSSIRAQISAVSGKGATVTLGGQTPNPSDPAKVGVITKRASIRITSSAPSNAQTSFNVTYRITNNSRQTLSVIDFQPRFYLNTTAGKDISAQFDYLLTNLSSTSFSIPASGTKDLLYSVLLARPSQTGTAIIDASLKYRVTASAYETVTPISVVTRYQNNSSNGTWTSGVSNPLSATIVAAESTKTWSLPDYISTMESTTTDRTQAFFNQNTLPQNSGLKIYFRNQGKTIDPTSLIIKLNGTTLSGTLSSSFSGSDSSVSYIYDTTNGVLTLNNLGGSSGSGTIQITVKDVDGVTLPTTTLTFTLGSTSLPLNLSNALFYPNPVRTDRSFFLGFNLTNISNSATVKFYIYNHLGLLVWTKEKTFTSDGYKLLASKATDGVAPDDATFLQDLNDILSPGVYACKIIVQDSRGNIVKASTKLAVY